MAMVWAGVSLNRAVTRLWGVTGMVSEEAKTVVLVFSTSVCDSRKADYGARKVVRWFLGNAVRA